ncbi:hypothetical protein ES707_10667 [subsurface metagenome]
MVTVKDSVIQFANKSITELNRKKERAENNIRINQQNLIKINLGIDTFNKVIELINKGDDK